MAQGVNGIDAALKMIEQNNNEIKAAKALWKAQAMEARSENVLGNTSVAYEKMFGTEEASEETGKLTVSQEMDFPTLYAVRNKVVKKQNDVSRMQYEETRRNTLLAAKELCIDMVRLRLQNDLINEKLENIASLKAAAERRFAVGDIGTLDLNKLKMQEMEENAARVMNENEMVRIARSLAAMNGGEQLVIEADGFGEQQRLPDFGVISDEVMASDASLMRSRAEHEAATAGLKLEKNRWLPSFELSYIREMHLNDANNGLEVGLSLPLFSNARVVKKAKAYKVYSMLQADAVHDNVSNEIRQGYQEAENLAKTLEGFDVGLVYDNIRMLKKALEAKHISTIDYFTEVNSLYGMLETYYTLRSDYEKALARLFKHRL